MVNQRQLVNLEALESDARQGAWPWKALQEKRTYQRKNKTQQPRKKSFGACIGVHGTFNVPLMPAVFVISERVIHAGVI